MAQSPEAEADALAASDPHKNAVPNTPAMRAEQFDRDAMNRIRNWIDVMDKLMIADGAIMARFKGLTLSARDIRAIGRKISPASVAKNSDPTQS